MENTETEMAKKILGVKNEEVKKEEEATNYLSNEQVWTVTKQGCGTSVFSGTMAAALMAGSDKKKALSGIRKFSGEKGFLFERK